MFRTNRRQASNPARHRRPSQPPEETQDERAVLQPARRRFPFDNHGRSIAQGMVEFALALPILLVLIYGIIEGARFLFIYSIVTTASREGARYAVGVGDNRTGIRQYYDCANIRAAAIRVGSIAGVAPNNILIAKDTSGNVYCQPPTTTDASKGPFLKGDRVLVTVSVAYSPIVPLVPLPRNLNVSATNARTVLDDVLINASKTPDFGSYDPFTPTPSKTPEPSSTPVPSKTPKKTTDPTDTPTVTPPPPLPDCATYNISPESIYLGGVTWAPYSYNIQVINSNPPASGITGHLVGITVTWEQPGNPKLTSVYFDTVMIASTNASPTSYSTTWPETKPENVLTENSTKVVHVLFSKDFSIVNVTMVFTVTAPDAGANQCQISVP